MSNETQTPARVARCPTCRKPSVPEHRPFCSRRCADIDLARWLGGGFVIAGSPLETADDSGLSAPPSPSKAAGPDDGEDGG